MHHLSFLLSELIQAMSLIPGLFFLSSWGQGLHLPFFSTVLSIGQNLMQRKHPVMIPPRISSHLYNHMVYLSCDFPNVR